MILFTEYESYFESLATDFKPISHTKEKPRFALMDIDDILSSQKTALDFNFPVMILENFEGQLNYKHSKMADLPQGAFHILQNVNRNNPAQKREVMDLTKSLGLKIITKMHMERLSLFSGASNVNKVLMYFLLDSVRYQKVSNVFSGCHGWRFEFNLGYESTLDYQEDEWFSLS
jgi:hypothetical protein